VDKGVNAKRFKNVSAQRDDLVNEVSVGYNHAAAAVPLQTQVVEDQLRIFAQLHPFNVGLIDTANDLAASEAPYWDDHSAHL
jgi:hypothetical protein